MNVSANFNNTMRKIRAIILVFLIVLVFILRCTKDEGINIKLREKIDSIVVSKLMDSILPRLEKSYGNFKGEVFCECFGCHNKFPVRSMDFNNGQTFCNSCFNNLPTNWKKEMIDKRSGKWFK